MKKLVFTERPTLPPEFKCSGCRYCEVVCSFEHFNVVNPARSRIQVFKGAPAVDKPIFCMHCGKPKCMEACPVEYAAITKNPVTGLVSIDPVKCTGCGLCIEACPFDAMVMDPVSKKVVICDLCGGDPQCVKFCAPHVLELREIKTSA